MEVDTCVQNEISLQNGELKNSQIPPHIDESDNWENEVYHDSTKIVPPKTLNDLIGELHKVFDSDKVNIHYVKALMSMYKSNPKEWKKFAKFDPHRYTRNLVDEGNGKFNLMVLCWNTAEASTIHNHANSHCFMKILDGDVNEELLDWPESEELHGMQPRQKTSYHKDEVTYICDDIGLHRIENPSHIDCAVSLHLYSPPFDECKCFDRYTGHCTNAKVTFWSKFGKRTSFEKGKGTE